MNKNAIAIKITKLLHLAVIIRQYFLENTDDIRGDRNPICNLPKVPGECKALLPRFYYDQAKGRCHIFIYGGCNGNENQFRTPMACMEECGGLDPITELNAMVRSNPRTNLRSNAVVVDRSK